MSLNPNSQYHIPATSYNPDVNQSSSAVNFDSINEIYDSQYIETPIYKSKAELAKEAMISRLNVIGTEIEALREDKIHEKPTRHGRDLNVFVNDLSKLFFKNNSSNVSYEFTRRNELISKESLIGARIFGLTNTETERADFFYEGRDENGVDHWFFYQDKQDGNGNHNSRTLHYEISNAGILLVGSGYLKAEELDKFILATEMYQKRVKEQLYSDKQEPNENIRTFGKGLEKIISFARKNSHHGNGQIAA